MNKSELMKTANEIRKSIVTAVHLDITRMCGLVHDPTAYVHWDA